MYVYVPVVVVVVVTTIWILLVCSDGVVLVTKKLLAHNNYNHQHLISLDVYIIYVYLTTVII